MAKVFLKWNKLGSTGIVSEEYNYGQSRKTIGSVTKMQGGWLMAKISLGENYVQASGLNATELKANVIAIRANYAQEMITVTNVLSNKEVQIQRGQRGGPCDPSTELYHSA